LEARERFFYLDILWQKELMAIVVSGDNTKIFPLYIMLCYLFDNNELTNAELKNELKGENSSIQFSCGWVSHKQLK
jgi:hypothetical protein